MKPLKVRTNERMNRKQKREKMKRERENGKRERQNLVKIEEKVSE